MKKDDTIRARDVARRPRGDRTLSLTGAAVLWCLRAGPLRAKEVLAGCDALGLNWSSESYYMSFERWRKRGLLTVERVRSRDAAAGVPGSAVELLLSITDRGRDELAGFVAVTDNLVG